MTAAPCLSVNMPALITQLKRHEGVRLFAYADTVGKLTIGVGRNLSDVGISADEAELLLQHDIERTMASLCAVLPWLSTLDEVRQRAIVDLAFNVGARKVLEFVRMLQALQRKDYDRAAQELWSSKWSTQVGPERAHRLVMMLKTGQVQP